MSRQRGCARTLIYQYDIQAAELLPLTIHGIGNDGFGIVEVGETSGQNSVSIPFCAIETDACTHRNACISTAALKTRKTCASLCVSTSWQASQRSFAQYAQRNHSPWMGRTQRSQTADEWTRCRR